VADPLQSQAASTDAAGALDRLIAALSRLRNLDDDPIVQGMLDSLLEQLQEASAQLQLYREELRERWQLSPAAGTAAGELVRQDAARILAPDGSAYVAHVYGEARANGEWIGWVTFVSTLGSAGRRTERETTQPSREALEYWASGLEPLYFEGAFARSVALGG
jgi:hypothetical protein